MPELITAVAQLMWPLIALLAIVVFRRAIGRVLRTAEKRELEFEIGGQKLTMHQVNDQQNEMIQDLQRQLSTLSKELAERDRAGVAEPPVKAVVPVPALPDGPDFPVEGNGEPPDRVPSGNGDGHGELPAVREPVGPEPFAVLWVAEKPQAHAILAEQLRDNGVRVTMVTTTDAALAELSQRPYRLIVEDMGRQENGRWRPDAGLALLRELRDLGVDTPVIVFSSQQLQQQYGEQARRSGAVGTTSSTYEMFQNFQSFDLL
ncbi:Response regulator receiver domain-containing protein [Saccharopolyspora antimicrobica]|uniref:Response regulator receiver domain-containing protein n=1 Tax=Saccharopolyspora antimicrobica TaxID=455193 RepID=A0A1I4Z2D8_9PSEU|nr:response regulator [Saccharopolyspora antimicrobica]RKT82903.1 response regulator receiver domain-containing protein [Saccharopolyspora antimicrobica]SFN44444.1 Response regulator receiver domain-containing protein [Saccharopolyspora antimicrobica]